MAIGKLAPHALPPAAPLPSLDSPVFRLHPCCPLTAAPVPRTAFIGTTHFVPDCPFALQHDLPWQPRLPTAQRSLQRCFVHALGPQCTVFYSFVTRQTDTQVGVRTPRGPWVEARRWLGVEVRVSVPGRRAEWGVCTQAQRMERGPRRGEVQPRRGDSTILGCPWEASKQSGREGGMVQCEATAAEQGRPRKARRQLVGKCKKQGEAWDMGGTSKTGIYRTEHRGMDRIVGVQRNVKALERRVVQPRRVHAAAVQHVGPQREPAAGLPACR